MRAAPQGKGRWPTALIAALGVAAACGGSQAGAASPKLLVFASASLAEAFQRLADDFQAANAPLRVELNFAGTPQLLAQLRAGAPADVLAAADVDAVAETVVGGRTDGLPRVFAKNRLAIVVAAGNPRRVTGVADLARTDLRVALCAPAVPAGRYARQALAAANVAVQSISDEPSVKALVAKVRLGELDVGIVYATDTRVQGVEGLPLPPAVDVVADYACVALRGPAAAGAARRFLDFVLSPAGQSHLAACGFQRP